MARLGGLDREEYIEQAYLYRTFRERLAENLPAQEILSALHEEILTTTRLPMAVQFLATELKHTGLMHPAFERLTHYFTPFQAFVVRQAEEDRTRLTLPAALMVLQREAEYRSESPTRPGLFVYQFEALARNRLGYQDGLIAIGSDPFYDEDWRLFLHQVRKQLGVMEFADLIYLRSETFILDRQRSDPSYASPLPPLFAEKEGKIARASRGRDPLFLFAALQRQLKYPEVPRTDRKDDAATQIDLLKQKIAELENRVKLVEGELRGSIDWDQFGVPEILKDRDEENL